MVEPITCMLSDFFTIRISSSLPFTAGEGLALTLEEGEIEAEGDNELLKLLLGDVLEDGDAELDTLLDGDVDELGV